MLKQKKQLKDSSLIRLAELRGVLNHLIDNSLRLYIRYDRLKEYIRLCVITYDNASENEKEYLDKYFFNKPKGE
nr:MAG TPA: hypothetical protein [Microviridae sp.]